MAFVSILSNHFKFQLALKEIDLYHDVIKICLMREGFQFNKRLYAIKKNIRTTSGEIDVTFNGANQTITRDSGSFISDGFVPGNRITTDSSNNPGPFIITNVTSYVITVSGGIVTEESVSKTINSDDELPSGHGYTQYDMILSNKMVVEDNNNDRAEMTCNDVVWTAIGGTIGPSPGALLIDATTTDETIIGYLGFDGNRQASDGKTFTIGNIKIRIS